MIHGGWYVSYIHTGGLSCFTCSRSRTFDKDITPYIHVFVYHAYYFAQKFGCLKEFEMEAVEQLNYVNKLVFFGCSNHGKENFNVTEQVCTCIGSSMHGLEISIAITFYL